MACFAGLRTAEHMHLDLLYQKYSASGHVSTDTRKIIPGCLYVALRGEKFNGNSFAEEALRSGAGWAVIDDPEFAGLPGTTLVPDTLVALRDLARMHRSRLNIPVIGLTGSNGKTTSKELVHAVLSTTFRTYATRGNLNNHIGVPLTVLSIPHDTQMAVVEMGANHVGEIALLSSIAQPTHGFITNIGKAHIGTFGGFENIIRGKTELFDFLLRTHGQVFINSNNPILAPMIRRFRDPVLYPGPQDFIHVELLETTPYLICRADGGKPFQTGLSGAYNFENIAAALAVGKFFGVDAHAAEAAVASYVPSNMRSQIITRGTNTVILDAYNANPSSMEAAIRNLQIRKDERKAVILGDMYELGDDTEKEHRALGEMLSGCGFDRVLLCGPLMEAAARACTGARHFLNKADLAAALEAEPMMNTTVLIKASRGMSLESLAEVIR